MIRTPAVLLVLVLVASTATAPLPASPTSHVTAARVRGDADGDGKADVFWHYNGPGSFNAMWFMTGSGPAASAAVQAGPTSPGSWIPSVFGADFDDNGRSDMLWLQPGTTFAEQMDFWFMSGSDVLRTFSLGRSSSIHAIGTGDLNGDGHDDIFPEKPGRPVWVMHADGSGRIRTLVATPEGAQGESFVGSGDFTGDVRIDAVSRNASTGENRMYVSGAFPVCCPPRTEPFAVTVVRSVPDLSWRVAAAADYDADGKTDLFWRNAESGDDAIWLMDGATIKVSATMPAVYDTNWTVATTGDFNGDGKVDLFWRNVATGDNAMWLMNGTEALTGVALPTIPDPLWMPVRQ